MSHRFLVPIAALTTVVLILSLAPVPVAGQQTQPNATSTQAPKAAPATAKWTPSKTPWGDPDLQGVFTYSTATPLERPGAAADRDAYTEAEIAALEEKAASSREADVVTAAPGQLGASYNAFWTAAEKGRLTGRTALLVFPENGRLPALTPEALKIRDELSAEASARRVGKPPFVHTIYNTWADHPVYTRCLAREIPRGFGQSYNHGAQILQSPGFVVIHYESMHDVRIIPLDSRPHLDSSVRLWNGDSRGHWEGDTLVVDSTNFTDKQEFQGAPQGNMHLTERFRRLDANTIEYLVTVDDPKTWTSSWTYSMPWRAEDPYQNPEDLYEFACHEGNYRMMEDSLSGSRALKETESAKP